MTISVGIYVFEGPYTDTKPLKDNSGVYAIHCYNDGKYFIIDVGESAKVKERVENHDRKDCWKRNCGGILTYSVYYTPGLQQPGRVQVEQAIRQAYTLPCGTR